MGFDHENTLSRPDYGKFKRNENFQLYGDCTVHDRKKEQNFIAFVNVKKCLT